MPVHHYSILHDYVQTNRCVTDEYDDVVLELVEGTLPTDLVGALYRNGNGVLSTRACGMITSSTATA